MNRPTRLFRTSVATPLAVAMLALSVAVPVLEVADLTHAPVVESEHAPDTCPPAHDHTVCTQVGANHSAAGSDAAERPIEIIERGLTVVHVDDVVESRSFGSKSARAPPRI